MCVCVCLCVCECICVCVHISSLKYKLLCTLGLHNHPPPNGYELKHLNLMCIIYKEVE